MALLPDKQVQVGVIDVATTDVETPEEVAATIDLARQYVDADRLIASTNCGMVPLSRQVARGKLEALVAGADLARRRLR
jgi:5-methyltetrahydropteroyltriglutamate--homocysteine methyltransferase